MGSAVNSILKAEAASISEPLNGLGLDTVHSGTTIIGIRFLDGVLLCSDTQHNSSYAISNRYQPKLTNILDKNYVGACGNMAVVNYLIHIMKSYAYDAAVTRIDREVADGIIHASEIASILFYLAMDHPSEAGNEFLIAGYDYDTPQLLHVTFPASQLQRSSLCIGSGSDSIREALKEAVDAKPLMTSEQAIEIARKMMHRAHLSDTHTGGHAKFVLISKDNVQEFVEPLDDAALVAS